MSNIALPTVGATGGEAIGGILNADAVVPQAAKIKKPVNRKTSFFDSIIRSRGVGSVGDELPEIAEVAAVA